MPFRDPDRQRAFWREHVAKRRATRRQVAIAYLGGVCANCGSTERLEFDHKDPAGKVNRIAQMWTASATALWRELDKCQLLCYECHREKTFGDGSYGEWGNQ